MPLFVAYGQSSTQEETTEKNSDENSEKLDDKSSTKLDWLVNQSFAANLTEISKETVESPASPVKETLQESSRESEESHADRASSRKKAKKRRSRSRSKSPKPKKKKKKKDKKKDDKDKRKPPKTLPLPRLPKNIVFSNNLGLRLDESFYVDCEKDRNNLAFASMYAKNVPRYIPAAGVMGIDQPRRGLRKPKKPLRYFRKAVLKRIATSAETNNEEETIRVKVAEFNEKLRVDSRNVKLWLEFLNFQEKALRFSVPRNGEEEGSKIKGVSHRSLIERKIAILDRAIENNPKAVDLIRVKLQVAAEVWESSTLQQEWKKMLFVHPTSVELWKSYLHFVEHYYEGFSVNNVLKSYASCIQKFVQMQKPSFASHQRPANLNFHLIDVFVHLCDFLKRSGLTEKSTALFQAILELNLNRPEEFLGKTEDVKGLLSLMEPFWDCGAPRFGEEDAIGWAAVLRTKQHSVRKISGRDLSNVEDEIISSGKPRSEVWLQIEGLRALHHWQPWTADPENDEECDDPERLVSIEDIGPFLFSLENDESLKFRLVVGFLSSIGVPITLGSQTQKLWSPSFDVENYFNFHLKIPHHMKLRSVEANLLENENYYNFAAEVFRQSFSKFQDPYKTELGIWWMNFEICRVSCFRKKPDFRQRWNLIKKDAKNLLKQIPAQNSRMNFLLYAAYARLEHAAGNGEDARKILSKILAMTSENPLSNPGTDNAALLHLWRTLMEILISSKKYEEAKNLLINLGSKMAYDPKFQSSAALQLKSKKTYEFLVSDLNFSMEKINEGIGLFSQVDFVVDFLCCFAYSVALTEGISRACSLIKDWLQKTEANMELNENNKFKSEVLQHHWRREAIYVCLLGLINKARDFSRDLPLNLYSTTLNEATTRYPGNSEILRSFIESEERCSIVSRLWTSLEDLAKRGNGLESVSVAYANCLALASREEMVKQGELDAWREVSRTHEIAVLHKGFENKIRRFAESCVSQPPGQHSLALWRLCLRAAFLSGNLNKCKALFYRAVRDCPSGKALYMDIVQYVPSMVKEVTQIMTEKELRLRFPLEELDVLLEPEPEDLDEEKDGALRGDGIEKSEQSEEDSSASEDESESFEDSFDDL